jgi:hypothetical protein
MGSASRQRMAIATRASIEAPTGTVASNAIGST